MVSFIAVNMGVPLSYGTVEQPIPVFTEFPYIPHRIVRRETDKPAEQKIVVELLHQLSFRAHAVKRLQPRSQQLLRRDRRSAVPRWSLSKSRDTRASASSASVRIVHRIVQGYPPLHWYVAEESFRPSIFPAHHLPQSKGIKHMPGITLPPSQSDFFRRTEFLGQMVLWRQEKAAYRGVDQLDR